MPTSPKMGGGGEAPLSILSLTQRPWAGSTPTPLTPLIGRAEERDLARRLIAGGVRLLTLHGPGGIGKSRLAVQLASDLQDEFAGGIAWVPLATVRDPDAVIPAIAKLLGIAEPPGQPVNVPLARALREGRYLLILDNVEQVLAAGEHIAELLAACPRLVAITTSRSLLRIPGEHAIEVPPLAMPEDVAGASHDESIRAEAVQLFLARAMAVAPGLAIDGETARLVAEICHQLEGVPLSIELAAARVNHLSIPGLRARLGQRLPLLTGSRRDQPTRHRSMRDAIAWSYDLLPGDAQRLLQRIAIFPGGCRTEALDQLGEFPGERAGSSPGSAASSLDSIAILVDHSMVRQVTDPDGDSRFSMLETIREYALEQLEASGEREDTEARKIAYLTALTEQAEFAPLVAGREPLLAILEREDANIRDTLLWLLETGEQEHALRLAGALSFSWIAQSRYREVRSWLAPLLADRNLGNPTVRGRALAGFGYMAIFQRDLPRAESAFAKALVLARAEENPLLTSISLIGSGVVAEIQDNHKRAVTLLKEALALSRTLDDSNLAASIASSAHANLGASAHGIGQLPLAHTHHLEALALRREIKSPLGVCRSLDDLGDVARDMGDYPRALAYYRESLAMAAEHQDRRLLADLFTGVASIAVAWDQPERAIRLLAMADSLRETAGIPILFAFDSVAHARVVSAARTVLDDDAFTSSSEAGKVMSMNEAITEIGQIESPA